MRVVALALALGAWCASPAAADGDVPAPNVDAPVAPPTYLTAHTLDRGELQIGLIASDVGIFDELDVGVDHLYYLLPFVNARTKARLYRNDRWAVSLQASFYYINTDWIFWLKSPSTRGWFVAVPLELAFSAPLTRHLSLHTVVALTLGTGEFQQRADDVAGMAASNNLQIMLTPEWRFNRAWALNLRFRVAPWISLAGNGSATVQYDATTVVRGYAEGDIDTSESEFAISGVATIHFTHGWFNSRIGAGWGNFNLRGANQLALVRTPIFELDVFARF